MLEEFNQMISVNPEGYDQARGRPSLACGRQTGVREDLLVLLLGPVCVVDGAAPSMLTHRETAVRATLSRSVRLGWWLQLPKQRRKGKPFLVCVWVCACAGHTAFVCACVSTLCVCVFVCFSPDSQEASAASDVAALTAFGPALSFWLTFLWYYLFIQSHVYKWRLPGMS